MERFPRVLDGARVCRALSIVCVVAWSGCVEPPAAAADGGLDGRGSKADAGTPGDAGGADAGTAPDAGRELDAGAERDAGSDVDAGGERDAGDDVDAGDEADGGDPEDGGAPEACGQVIVVPMGDVIDESEAARVNAVLAACDDVRVVAAGSLTVAATLEGSGALTLTAGATVLIAAPIAVGDLTVEYGQARPAAESDDVELVIRGGRVDLPAGQTFRTCRGSDCNGDDGSALEYTVITALGEAGDATTLPSPATLQGVARAPRDAHFALGADIDASVSATWNGGEGFRPIGGVDPQDGFAGTFDGLGHVVSNLSIDSDRFYVGLFSVLRPSAEVRHLRLEGGTVRGYKLVGALAGGNNGVIRDAYASVAVEGKGLGDSPGDRVGGLVGTNAGRIARSAATGAVSATGESVGGLVGASYGALTDCYATGDVESAGDVGGLVGALEGGSVSRCYATGAVTAEAGDAGGLAGRAEVSSIADSFWATDRTGQATSAGGSGAVGKLWIELTEPQEFLLAGWDLSPSLDASTVWWLGANELPKLRAFLDAGEPTDDAGSPDDAGTADGGVPGGCLFRGFAPPDGVVDEGEAALISAALVECERVRVVSVGALTIAAALEGDGALTLTAARDLSIEADVTAGALSVEYGQASTGELDVYALRAGKVSLPAGPTFEICQGASCAMSAGMLRTFTVITSLGVESDATTAPESMTLQGLAASPYGGNVALGADIDADATGSWNAGQGFSPIVSAADAAGDLGFHGTFDGLGHVISGLTIKRNDDRVGLFRVVAPNGMIRNLTLEGHDVSGGATVGSLVGRNHGVIVRSAASGETRAVGAEVGGLVGWNGGQVLNSEATGPVEADGNTLGGLVGFNQGVIRDCAASGPVRSVGNVVGGLVGYSTGAIEDSVAAGDVTGRQDVGGLVGLSWEGSVARSAAYGVVDGSAKSVGGLVGYSKGQIEESYASGAVRGGSENVGGLVGHNDGAIVDSYALGEVEGVQRVGGLVGRLQGGGSLARCYSVGEVSGTTDVGGLVGRLENATVTSAFWATDSAGQATSAAGTGKTLAALETLDTFTTELIAANRWDISVDPNGDTVWWLDEGNDTPKLRALLP